MVGAVCAGVSLLIGYHQDQQSADRAMAQKAGLPDQVLIQDFTSGIHDNLIGEVRVLGEIRADDSILLNIGSDPSPSWLRMTPIYPVGRDTLPFAEQFLAADRGEPRRALRRDASVDLAQRAPASRDIGAQALAFMVEPADSAEVPPPTGPETRYDVIATTDATTLIRLEGRLVSDSGPYSSAADAVLASGPSTRTGQLMIEPSAFARDALDTDPWLDHLRRWLMALGLLIAIAPLSAPIILVLIEGRPKPLPVPVEVPSAGAFPAIRAFQPIATQDELRREEEFGVVQSLARDRIARLGSAALGRIGRLRSRR